MHWPFCRSKCPYCDFNSHVAAGIDHENWRKAYRAEIAHYAARLPGREISSIFFGGGTPSLMEAKTVASIIDEIGKHWGLSKDVEITLEANPGSAEAGKFADFRAAGVNRLSLGIQALREDVLKFLGRAHNANEGKRAIELAARTFPRYSFDLIYARPDQTPELWEAELKEALALAGDHLSLYQLTIEPNTQFHTRYQRGEKLTAPDDNAAAMYEQTQSLMADAGLPAYEISNHARPGEESRHNLTYWHYEDYIGIGPGAHGRYVKDIMGYGSAAHRAPEVWLRNVDTAGHGLRVEEAVDSDTAQREALMMGLRLAEGIDDKDWRKKFGAPLMGGFASTDKIARLRSEDYIAADKDRLKPTLAGLQRLNSVLAYLID